MSQKDRLATQTPKARAASCASVVFPQDCEYLALIAVLRDLEDKIGDMLRAYTTASVTEKG